MIGKNKSMQIKHLDMRKVSLQDDCVVMHTAGLNTERLRQSITDESFDEEKSAEDFKEVLLSSGILFNQPKQRS